MNESYSRKARVSGSYARIYAALAVVSLSMSLLPLYSTVHTGTLTTEYGSVWQMAGRSPVGVVGILLLVGAIAIFVLLNFRPPTAATLPFVGAAINAVAFLGITVKPGTGTPSPPLAEGGIVLSACALMSVIACAAQGIQLSAIRNTERVAEVGTSAPDSDR